MADHDPRFDSEDFEASQEEQDAYREALDKLRAERDEQMIRAIENPDA